MASDQELELEQTEQAPEEEAYAKLKFEIVNYPSDLSLRGYHSQWKNGQLRVPDFQRNYVWSITKASKLIESFIIGLPVPGVFLFRPKNASTQEIIDGQQRIMSAVRYLEGDFDKKAFALKGVQKPYEGCTYAELSEEIQFKLENSILRATIIQQLSPDDNTSVYQIFERLNTGGENLNSMEIRQSISYGSFVRLLKELNLDPNWREILGSKEADKRLRDVELVLRVLAFKNYIQNYDKPMKDFLNKYMEAMRNRDDLFEELAVNFRAGTKKIIAELGPRPFHLYGRLNFAALDSIMSIFLKNLDTKAVPDKFAKIVSDDNFVQAVRFNTSDESAIKSRLNIVSGVFGE